MVCVHLLDAAGARPRPNHRFVRARRVVGASILAAASAAVGVGVATLPARAATTNRAAVVVEVDGVIHTAKVTFSTDSISGLDALRSAGFDPLVRVFGGNGGAVCALDVGATTIGCPADTSCLKCAAPDYWAYFRALAGATAYTYSSAGAGLTQVHDGDVEAWVWGRGSPPSRFVSFRDVWGPDPTPTTRPSATTTPTTPPTTSRPRSTPTTLGKVSTPTPTAQSQAPTSSSGSAAATPPQAKVGSSTSAPRAGSLTSAPASTTHERAGAMTDGARRVATAPVVKRGGGGSPYGLVGFAAVLAALVGAIVFARHRRRSVGLELPT